MSKIFIFGCGYLGMRLADALIESGHEVGVLTKNEVFADHLRAKGIREVIVARLESDSWHDQVSGDYRKIVNCVSSAGNGLSGYESSYYEGQASIIQWVKSKSMFVESYIYTSSTSVYGENSGAWVEESSLEGEVAHSETAKILRRSEDLIEANQSYFENYFILRLSGIYGPGRHYLLNQMQSFNVIAGSGDNFMNMIHVDDIVIGIMRMMETKKASASGIYNLSDDHPTKKEEVVEWLSGELGIEAPRFDQGLFSQRHASRKTRTKNRRIANIKIKEVLGLSLKYSSYKEGYSQIIGKLS
jgi:nucleoside-diphosphate-sugar epimerase